jgi:hypothetical protein
MQSRLMRVATAGVLSMCMSISTALAGSVTQPGETVGIPTGAPLPQGLYFTDTVDWGCRTTSPTTCLGITIRSSRGRRLGRSSARGCRSSR